MSGHDYHAIWHMYLCAGPGTYYVGGFRCATGPGCYYGIEAQAGYMIVNGSMQFGPCTVAHIVASDGALVWLDSAITTTIGAGANAN